MKVTQKRKKRDVKPKKKRGRKPMAPTRNYRAKNYRPRKKKAKTVTVTERPLRKQKKVNTCQISPEVPVKRLYTRNLRPRQIKPTVKPKKKIVRKVQPKPVTPKKGYRQTKKNEKTLRAADRLLYHHDYKKHTQMYKCLKARHLTSPIFMNRNLTYMMQDRPRIKTKPRTHFKINYMLALKTAQIKRAKRVSPGFTIKILDLYDGSKSSLSMSEVEIEIIHYKNKDNSSSVPVITSQVVIKPTGGNLSPLLSPISIPTLFLLSEDAAPEEYNFSIKVLCLPPPTLLTKMENTNNRRKLTRNHVKKRLLEESTFFGSELPIFNEHEGCLFPNGCHELFLQEVGTATKNSAKKHYTWEDEADLADLTDVLNATKGPILKFEIMWAKEYPTNRIGNHQNSPTMAIENDDEKKQLHITYQYFYDGHTRLETKLSKNLYCPFCDLDCKTLYKLLKHLTLNHYHFNFSYVPTEFGGRIDVTIKTKDELDGIDSYIQPCCDPHLPMVWHPIRPNPSLSEFIQPWEQLPFPTGFNRKCWHSTGTPIGPPDVDVNSEDDSEQEWLQINNRKMIDRFADVNDGEKEIMEMWNDHMAKNAFVGDCQIPLACNTFVEEKGSEILLKKLYRNFALHMTNLFDFGLVSNKFVYKTMKKLQKMANQQPKGTMLLEAREAQTYLCTKLDKSLQHRTLENFRLPSPQPTKRKRRRKRTTRKKVVKKRKFCRKFPINE